MRESLLRLHLGCGRKHLDGFINVDIKPNPGVVDRVYDLNQTPWPWVTNSVEEIICKHVIEHLDIGLCGFLDEAWRVLHPAGTVYIQVPDAANPDLAWADPTHKRPYRVHSFANYFTLPGIRKHGVTRLPWCWYVVKSEGGVITAHGNPAKGFEKEVQ